MTRVSRELTLVHYDFIYNIVSNAVDHHHEKGWVVVYFSFLLTSSET